MSSEQEKVEALKREGRELDAALAALRGLERVGELDWSEEERKRQIEDRIAEIRAEAEERRGRGAPRPRRSGRPGGSGGESGSRTRGRPARRRPGHSRKNRTGRT